MEALNFIQQKDADLFLLINNATYPEIVEKFFLFITQYPNLMIILLIIIFTIFVDNKDKSLQISALVFISLIVINIVGAFIKDIIGRIRPCHDISQTIEREPCSNSFGHPSKHSAFAMCVATIIEHYYPEYRIPILTAPMLVGLSRIVVGNHYPLDVVAGLLMGRITGKLLLYLYISITTKPNFLAL